MIDLALDRLTGDLIIRRGNPVVLDGPERVAQAVGIRLRTFAGEWFLDVGHGVPYFERVLGKQRPELVEAVLRAQILGVRGVARITTFSLYLEAATRTARINFAVETAEGTATGTATLSGVSAAA